jgi:hypothetical protein
MLLSKGITDFDYEERTIWQPWWKYRCNFAVRYIVPNRINIIEIMEGKGQFTSEVRFILVVFVCTYQSLTLCCIVLGLVACFHG